MTSLPRGSAEQILNDLTHICDWCDQPRVCSPASTGSGTLWICGPCADRAIELARIDDERGGHA